MYVVLLLIIYLFFPPSYNTPGCVILSKYFSGDQITKREREREREMAENVARIGERRVAYRVLVGKPEGKRTLGRRTSRMGDNTETNQ